MDGQPEFASYWGIDVLPAWNVMLDEGRLWNGVGGAGERGVPREGPWTTKQIQRYGVGLMDTGISNAPDLKGKVAALFSVVQSKDSQPKASSAPRSDACGGRRESAR
ncbi:MAG TPA: hypothetical protein VGF81_07715 [Solirubrobacteraceae bacterium]